MQRRAGEINSGHMTTIEKLKSELELLHEPERSKRRSTYAELWDDGFLTGAGRLPRANNPFISAKPAEKRKR